jgi:hypothetical protein
MNKPRKRAIILTFNNTFWGVLLYCCLVYIIINETSTENEVKTNRLLIVQEDPIVCYWHDLKNQTSEFLANKNFD